MIETDRVSWNMKPGRSNLSEKGEAKKKKNERACLRVSKLGEEEE